jgi:hypothetical protein
VKHAIWILPIGLFVAACEGEKAPTPPPAASAPVKVASAAAVTTATPATAPPPTSATASTDIPTEEDYEEEAAQPITRANLETEIDALEKEIAAP